MDVPTAGPPLFADALVALLQRALTLDEEGACFVHVKLGGDLVQCTAEIGVHGDIVITPVP